MFTSKDLQSRTIFVINCIEKRQLKVRSGELLLEDSTNDRVLTKMPFQKILALFVIGHISITTPLIDKCKRHNVALVVFKPNLRPVFFWSDTAEANYLLRQRQHQMSTTDITIAKVLVKNKIRNQHKALCNTRQKNDLINMAKDTCLQSLDRIIQCEKYDDLMGIEGITSRMFFRAYFERQNWTHRKPRAKVDAVNATLDIGYTILFNYMEAFVRMFGFDLYVGVYHRLWFKRKSLICDLIEPFRCIIDAQVRKAFNTGQCSADDFNVIKHEHILKRDKNQSYQRMFYDVLIARKMEFFVYVQSYYRCFMQRKSVPMYPEFNY